jgi:ribokinase
MAVKVTVVGSINIDLVTQVARFPEPGETILGGDLETIPGGKGANQAVAAVRLGSEVAMVGRLGDDVFATQLRQNLVEDGVDVTYVSESPETASGVALIVVDNDGQNSIVVASGANAKVTAQDVDRAAEAITTADVLLLQLEIPLEAVRRAAEIAHERGVKVILNPAPAQTLPADILSLVDILIPNESELSALSGLRTTSLMEMKIAASKLRRSGVETVILTAGENGALLAGTAGDCHFPAFSLKKVVDTTAAGDAFVAGVATAIAEGKSLSEAVPWGNAAGALAITRAGAQPSLPSRAEVETLLNEATIEQRLGVEI